MERISFRKVKTSVYHIQPTDDDILHFSLDSLLPDGHTMALNPLFRNSFLDCQ